MARPWPMPGGRARRPRYWLMPIPPRGRIGPCFPRNARSPISSAIMSKRKPTMRRRSKSCRLSGMFCPISDFPTRFRKNSRKPKRRCKKPQPQHDADRPVRQNLALVLALEGKFASAEEVARRDLDAKDAAANVAAIRRMIAQSNTWKRIQELDTKPQPAGKTHVGSNIE